MPQDKTLGQTLYFSQFGGERPIPDAFVAAMERAETRTSGYVADAEIPDDVKADPNVVDAYFDSREQRTNEKVLVVVRKKAGNISLQDFRVTDQGLTLQVTSTLFYTTDPAFVRSYPSATQDVAIRDLGNRWSIQEVAVSGTWSTDDPPVFVPGFFQGVELVTRKDDPLPAFMRTGVTERQTQSVVEGTVAQPTIGINDLEARERQLAEQRKLLSRLTRDAVALPAIEKLSVEIDDLLPARFRGLIPTTKSTTVVEGTVTTPTLAPGDLVRAEQQISTLAKYVEVVSRAGVTFPIVVVDVAVITEYGGGKVNITSTIDMVNTLTVDEGEGIVSSKVTKLGEGHELKETVARQDGAWPVRSFAKLDSRLQLLIVGTKQVVAKGSTTAGISGGVVTEVQEIDGYREDRILTTQPISAVDSYIRVLAGNNTNVDVPPHLESLTGYIDLNGGAGSFSENGYYTLSGTGGGMGSIQLHGSCQASASALPELGHVIKIPKTSNVPALHLLFYVPENSTRAAIVAAASAALNAKGFGTCVDWPDFRPQPITILTVGGKVNGNVQVTASAHDSVSTDYLGAPKFNGSSRSNGAGISYDVARISRILTIPPTIHGVLSIAGDTALNTGTNYSARGVINGGVAGAIADTGTWYATASGAIGTVSSTAATTGVTSFSGLGQCIHRLVTEIDPSYPRLRVFAEIVNFTDIQP